MSVFDEIQVAAFDIDGTLYPNYQMYIWGIPQMFFCPRILHAYNEVRKEIRETDTSGENFTEAQARLMAVRLETLPSRAAEKVARYLYRPWAVQTRIIRPVKGLREFLVKLKAKGISLYALSDFPVGRKLEYLGVADLFTEALCSEDYGRLKPDIAPFKALQKRTGVPASQILYFGNSYDKDIAGARNAGMKTAYITRKAKPEKPADLVYRHYRELSEMLP